MLAAIAALILGQTPIHRSAWEDEVVYQIFPRSFRDSNGDRVGDLKGLEQGLDYIKSLGATAILLNPIQSSRMYHNYFADDFTRIDPEFGTNDDLFHLVRQAHRKHLKVILDMEVQYVADQHPWATSKEFSAYLWDDRGIFTSQPLPMYDGSKIRAQAVDLLNPQVLAYFQELFQYWANSPGRAKDGVDGFRIDHMMDDLDSQGVKKGLLQQFWKPLIDSVRKKKPGTFFIGEQADWGFGADLFSQAGVDAVFAFPLGGAMLSRDRKKIESSYLKTVSATPSGRTDFLFIENHDLPRYASLVQSNPSLLRLGAVLNLTLKGTPILYYGQELGMIGAPGKWGTDGNDIPMRLAFRWTKDPQATPNARWYGEDGPWKESAEASDKETAPVEEQTRDGRSLLNFYRRLVALRRSSPALREGAVRFLDTGDSNVLAYVREAGRATATVFINFGERALNLPLPSGTRVVKDLWQETRLLDGDPGGSVELPAGGFRIVETRADTPRSVSLSSR